MGGVPTADGICRVKVRILYFLLYQLEPNCFYLTSIIASDKGDFVHL